MSDIKAGEPEVRLECPDCLSLDVYWRPETHDVRCPDCGAVIGEANCRRVRVTVRPAGGGPGGG